MNDTYHGYTNWETWTAMMGYDEELYDMGKECYKAGMTFEQFKDRVEETIYDDCEDGKRYPGGWTLVGEFVSHCLSKVNFKEMAELVWEEVCKDHE